ncbi:hypothetical protein chiPu_0021754 [Chiloscyllium punctatum]|uniref:Uncharacterized protein n=1 Tax=Chiloscyllium punctatum TaxID=137246 RepID=A0A401RLN2_CHIPU|nr:hypothetical protein [Chiloscyllium punctatum]
MRQVRACTHSTRSFTVLPRSYPARSCEGIKLTDHSGSTDTQRGSKSERERETRSSSQCSNDNYLRARGSEQAARQVLSDLSADLPPTRWAESLFPGSVSGESCAGGSDNVFQIAAFHSVHVVKKVR